jgi:hypothetical protein
MSIINIESIHQENGKFHVTAVIDEIVQTHPQTQYEPAEYGPALCETSFTIDDEELRSLVFPENDDEIIKFLEELDLFWNVIDNSDYDIGLTD